MTLMMEPDAKAVTQPAERRAERTVLRFITCGSVDDGKSTLIGRLLYDSKMLFEDQIEALKISSRKQGTQNGEMDFALLLDGLAAEREQGITIDVAYRYFATERRKFIVADTPGHEQYTRNMVTGASTADAAVLLVDARKGLLTQTRRHSYLVSLMGIRNVVLAINKMDAVGFSQHVYENIVQDYVEFARQIGFQAVTAIPISALRGDNVVTPSSQMPWYRGPTLLSHLETLELPDRQDGVPFRMFVQWVNRPHQDFRGFSGMIASGRIGVGDTVLALPAGRKSRVARIVTYDGELDEAVAGQSVTLTLDDELDISRGDLLCVAEAPAGVADQFEATVIWMADEPMLPGRTYWLKLGTKRSVATVTDLKYVVNVNSLAHLAAKQLELNAVGICNICVDRAVPFDPYSENAETGGFILVDKMTNATVGAGLIHFALRRSHNIVWQSIDINKRARASTKGQRPCILWFTGLSGAGKSTIANLVEKRLHSVGRHTYLLDGDNVRHGLNKDLGFTDADRVENIRRIGEVSKLMVDAGLIVMVAFISPFRMERQMARNLVEADEFIEVFVDTPIAVAEGRDPKGLYQKARRGEIANFTGIDSPYEKPVNPEITIDTTSQSAEQAADLIVRRLVAMDIVPPL